MAITAAVVGALAGDTRHLIDRRKDAQCGSDGKMAALVMRRGWMRPELRSALLRPLSRRRGKAAGFADGAYRRNQPPAAAAVAEAKTIDRSRTAPA
jgi:hypothetical protein